MNNTNLMQTAIKGFLWLFAGTLGQHLLQFITLIVLARFITPKDFGIVSLSILIISFLKIFSEMGVGPALVQKKDLVNNHIKTANTITIILGISLSLLLYISSNIIADFFNAPELYEAINFLAMILPIISLSVVGQSLLQRNLKFKEIAVYNLISYFVGYAIIAIPLAIYNFGLWALLYAYFVQVTILFIIIRIKVKESNKYGFNIKCSKELLNFGFGFSIARISNFFALEADNIIIGKFLGTEALGFYGRAYQLMTMPAILIGSVIDKVMFPIMTKIQDDKEKLTRIYLSSISLTTMLVMPLSVFIIVLGEEIILLILGNQWTKIIPILQILTIALVFRMSYKFSDSLARALGAVYKRAWRQVLYAISVFSLAWIGHFYGLQGVAIGVVIAIFINFLLMMQLSKQLLLFTWIEILRIHTKHLIISLILFLILFYFKIFISVYITNLFLIILLSIIVSIILLAAMWFLLKNALIQELKLLKSVLLNFKGKNKK